MISLASYDVEVPFECLLGASEESRVKFVVSGVCPRIMEFFVIFFLTCPTHDAWTVFRAIASCSAGCFSNSGCPIWELQSRILGERLHSADDGLRLVHSLLLAFLVASFMRVSTSVRGCCHANGNFGIPL